MNSRLALAGSRVANIFLLATVAGNLPLILNARHDGGTNCTQGENADGQAFEQFFLDPLATGQEQNRS